MKIQAAGKSHVGKRRDRNEDAFLIDNVRGLYAVSDGMGGHRGGEVAAFLGLAAIEEKLRELGESAADVIKTHEGQARLQHQVEEAFAAASQTIVRHAQDEPSLRGMGAALSMILVAGNKALLGHVGHCRVYLKRGETLSQLSYDHTIVNELVHAGVITPEETKTHAFRHVLNRALGLHETVLVDTLLFDILPGDLLLLCSDGLYRHLKDEAQLAQLVQDEPWKELPNKLVDWAVGHDEEDDITILAVHIPEVSEEVEDDHGIVYDALVIDQMERLYHHFLGKGLRLRELLEMLCVMDRLRFDEDQQLMAPGQARDGLYLVEEGALQVSHQDGGTAVLQEGDSVGTHALVAPYESQQSWTASAGSTLLHFSFEAFQSLVRRHPRFGVRLYHNLCLHLCQNQTRH